VTPVTDSSADAPTVAVLGEAILDFTSTGRLAFQGHPGGSPLNTGVAAARLGQRVTALGQFSTDQFGRAITEWLSANGVTTTWASLSDDPCALAFVTASSSGAEFSFRGFGSADTRWNPSPRPVLPTSLRGIQLSMLSCFAELTASSSEDVLRAHRDRAVILLDPTVRPQLVDDRVGWWSLLERFGPLAHIIKASDQDLDFVLPGVDPLDACRRLLTFGPTAVILTAGDDGASLVRMGTDDVLHVAAPKVDVVDTIGAGDTFAGALLSWMIDHGLSSPDDLTTYEADGWLSAMTYAAQAAAITCTRAGANPPTSADLALAYPA
jgi:fructokinase